MHSMCQLRIRLSSIQNNGWSVGAYHLIHYTIKQEIFNILLFLYTFIM